jgi:hypothetical protein
MNTAWTWFLQNVTGNLVASVIAFVTAHLVILKPALAKLHAKHDEVVAQVAVVKQDVAVVKAEVTAPAVTPMGPTSDAYPAV